ncbi:MAG: hypothetical protein KZQ66_05870 [Candidatus Thiodiazotropha sp. (ex Lucinoma aequizonata)]|nr:hypothetical protein [Candidatus Thiodiazotropha sp. (ex Lucinoma aequizonata)]MCU7889529.1 hypothetical protein [Candidatus Thiodiazotropha sp. (ex Lucinoma aequizonata)]MCU7899659.1 hypothetical protein [Candidatus Thiodiazotropha sp. (ex Lucinoma aequizonata)]MCU7901575.1 hypothetical protein [Candidatus Thiodiazotropha sp. (ex Lucinoma aequizonata)]MCU7908524.1 hypothetical protein [Candidatus Thiodiazotropha sp. (ex Lucinoma aequizonata)]
MKDFGTSQSTKIDSIFNNMLWPQSSCVSAISPHHRKLGAGYSPLHQMT